MTPGLPGTEFSTIFVTGGISTSSPVKISLPVLAPYGKEIALNSAIFKAWAAFSTFLAAALTVSISLNCNSLSKTCSGPVSYTHLDVYKRQR